MISLSLLLAAALTQQVTALNLDHSSLDLSLPVFHPRADPVILQPIRKPRPNNNVNKRDNRDSLALKPEETFYWQGADGTVAKFNIKAADSHETIVNLEDIDDLITKISCPASSTGDLKLGFAESADFNDAEDIWDWVNRDIDNHFLLVVGQGDCGFNSDRILYNVTSLSYDDPQETAILQVSQTTWKTAAKTFDLTIGQGALPPRSKIGRRQQQQQQPPRSFDDFIERVKSGFEKVKEGVQKGVDKLKETFQKTTDQIQDAINQPKPANTGRALVIPFRADGLTNKSLAIDDPITASITCLDCSTSGSISISAQFSAREGKISAANIDLSLLEELQATAILGLAITEGITESISRSLTIFEFSPAGIVIPGVLTIGPTVAIELGAELSEVTGAVDLKLGGKAFLPKGSSAKLDFLSEEKFSKNGWELGFEGEEFEVDAGVGVSAGSFLRGSLGVEISALGNGFRAELNADLLKVAAKLAGLTSETCTACGSFPLGVSGDLNIGVSVDVQLTRKVGGAEETLIGLSLVNSTLPIVSVCRGFEVEGLREQCVAPA
ncbi:hypothetical protein QBC38DRAFT_121344 [Podospora fimiseda]|uniref:Uncharacterized protein n=1 Tax=Podospora fimiseda TaxID=252190 RepID=A0AAN6YMT1_9PEZI|nr:hypothetical protein QBC38DRAFT_121344 [Podospora fimiseda]